MSEEYDLEIEHRAFDLHPGIPLEGELVQANLQRAGGPSSFARLADEAGLEHGERHHRYNSTPAHEATEWATEQGQGDAFRRAVYRAYFVEDRNIGSAEVLTEIATQLGLDPDSLRSALEDRRYHGKILTQFEEAHNVGVSAVPTFVAGGYALVGAHPLENFRKLMAAVGEEPRITEPGPHS
ncbi:MAG: hypothetical protein EXR58_05385 [Chloroflexi bacterium]|nr:hypothetical protein [Chloroflexota bacterium]